MSSDISEFDWAYTYMLVYLQDVSQNLTATNFEWLKVSLEKWLTSYEQMKLIRRPKSMGLFVGLFKEHNMTSANFNKAMNKNK